MLHIFPEDKKPLKKDGPSYPVLEAAKSNCIGIVRESPDGGFIVCSERGVEFAVEGNVVWMVNGSKPLSTGDRIMFCVLPAARGQVPKATCLTYITH